MPLPAPARSQLRYFLRSVIAGLGGVALLIGGLLLVQPLRTGPLRSADLLCVGAAMIYLMMSMVMTYVHLVRPRDAPMPRARALQVINLLLGGIALLLPIASGRFLAPGFAFMLVFALYVTSAAAAWILWREADELMRAILRDASAASFHITFVALAIYASGERLGVLSGGTAWAFLGFVVLASLMCSCWAIYRHGAGELPAER